MASESEIQSAIFERLRVVPAQKGYFYPSNIAAGKRAKRSHTVKGTPDITGCYRGRWVGLEVKDATGAQRESQAEFQEHIEQPGGFYFIVRSVAEVEAALKVVDARVG